MNNEMQRIWEALREIYGNDLMAATLVVLVKDGEGVKYVSVNYPQETQ